ncbi:MAG: allantoinase AllB [Candidatus Sericytochromatia bacterium]|nr:allantoinase AllB [Candidatus Tanganyikabacteria bacterium]
MHTGLSSAFVLRGRRVLTPAGERAACVVVREGRIADVTPFDAPPPPDAEVVDAGEAAILPGFVDTHVHVNEPGRTEWEGFESATRAAAAGGITSIVDMPLNSLPVTTTPAGYEAKRAASAGKLQVDCGFWGGLVPENAADLGPLLDCGVLGVKAFMIDSGIPEFPEVGERELRLAMPQLAARGRPLLLHAEVSVPHLAPPPGDSRRYATYLASRPPEMEVAAIRQAIALCREFGGPVHIVHLSAADALPYLAAARAEGLPVTVETCPHYLAFAAEDIPDGATEFKCTPPIRDRENRERLWEGLEGGVIDFVVCDHSPCTPALKRPEEGDFLAAWGGVASVQFGPAIVWTHARRRGLSLARVATWLSAAPARLAGLARSKGRIAPGCDADLVVWDPDASFAVTPDIIRHRHPTTPYAGQTLGGRARATYLRGRLVQEDGIPIIWGAGKPLVAEEE